MSHYCYVDARLKRVIAYGPKEEETKGYFHLMGKNGIIPMCGFLTDEETASFLLEQSKKDGIKCGYEFGENSGFINHL